MAFKTKAGSAERRHSLEKYPSHDQRPNESSKSYEMFRYYLSTDERSLQMVADIFNMPIDYVQQVATNNSWTKRSLSYDKKNIEHEINTELLEVPGTTPKDEEDGKREKHLRMGTILENMAIRAAYLYNDYLTEWELKKKGEDIRPIKPPVDPQIIIKIAEAGANLSLRAMKQATTITEKRETIDYPALSRETLDELRAIFKNKAGNNTTNLKEVNQIAGKPVYAMQLEEEDESSEDNDN